MNIVRAFLVAITTIWVGCATSNEESVEESAIWADDGDGEVIDADLAIDACVEAGLCGPEEEMPRRPPPPTELQTCVSACNAGPSSIEAFCRALPYPALKAGCWALVYAGKTVCTGWCLWHFS